ncbi:hypothetical protein [Domibacillus epiphyticus]|uniref:Uncharacterized protein n=1 Tax=Domibacillus epiphyticus TaxID=1714355 RepID=A0A1V2A7B0_9BACI|nr:hypothetical protein [Domibacillus epiphyticus]OMP66891.1 hypothetical protein BTO28_09770 [Domibacillus epiphyticus]
MQFDTTFLFEGLSDTIQVNGIDQRAIITNPPLSENEERHLHTEFLVSQGDLIIYEQGSYLSLTETNIKRHCKYKTLIRHCNFMIEVAGETITRQKLDASGNPMYDEDGRPVMETVIGEPIFIPAIIDNKKSSIDDGTQLRVLDNEIYVTVQDNEVNREKFILNAEISPTGDTYKINNVNNTKRGLLILTAERVAS